ncbi:MAG: hypothetical protein EOP02_01220 [Proteobacteria bacterium]|nr:MAG: hypothetical protein EOP02_01220 [Pseudomonadota bacterium]
MRLELCYLTTLLTTLAGSTAPTGNLLNARQSGVSGILIHRTMRKLRVRDFGNRLCSGPVNFRPPWFPQRLGFNNWHRKNSTLDRCHGAHPLRAAIGRRFRYDPVIARPRPKQLVSVLHSAWRWWYTLAGILLAAPLAVPQATAAEIAGITLPETEVVQGTHLALGACAVREELWTNLYVVSLYLPQQPNMSVAQLSASHRPRLVRIDVTYDGAVPDGLPSSWKDRLQQQVAAEFLRTFQGLYNNLRGGDVVRLSYAPQTGTVVSVNGREVATRPGDAVFNTMAQMWIGPDPISENIKRLLLKQAC